MKCIVYVSSASGQPDELDLGAILRESQRNNAAAGITGVLLHADGNFMQALEGEAEAVDVVMGKIRRDRRHHNLIELVGIKIPQRQFPRWSMAPRRLGDLSEQDQADCVGALTKWRTRPDAPEIVPEIKTLLNSFLDSMG
jgi:hypothetical protein